MSSGLKQYDEVGKLKENLHEGHALIVMDFAENFVCENLDEVQSAYYSKPTISLHPSVLYYKEGENLKHKSYVFCSDNTDHKAATVLTIMKKLDENINVDFPFINTLHYNTHSPTSQYRNKTIFQIVANYQKLFNGKKASWTYMEAGHSKGVCDGVGGASKRMAM